MLHDEADTARAIRGMVGRRARGASSGLANAFRPNASTGAYTGEVVFANFPVKVAF